MMKIELTTEQKAILEPLFQSVRDANSAGETAAIGAQVWPDGFVVNVFKGNKVRALAAVLGGNGDYSVSADDRISKHLAI